MHPILVTGLMISMLAQPAPPATRGRSSAPILAQKKSQPARKTSVSVTGGPVSGPPIPAPEKILSTLRPSHPRLIILDEDIARTRQAIQTNSDLKAIHDQLRRQAIRMLDDPPVVHKLIGPRLLDQSRTCLRRVYTFATLYRLDHDERFLKRAEKEMLAAAAFPDWNPSHFLDTAEMTHALAIGYDWLYADLSPSSRATIRTAIIEKGLKPSVDIYKKGGWWARAIHNWSQVCNGGMTIGALAVAEDDPELAGFILSQAAASIRLPTARLRPDGGWDEGPGYWNYAMSYTAYYMAAMQTALGTDFGLKDFPGLADTGLFRIHSTGPSGAVFNYADASEIAGSATQMYYFARLFNRPVYAWHHRHFSRNLGALDLLWYDPRGTLDDMRQVPLDAYFKNVDVAFLRSEWTGDALYIGFKGGDNAANHSHLDLGTFVLDAESQRWAIDLGADDYNLPGYFGNQRWNYYRLRTEGQNTLVFDGQNQDPKAKAPIVAFKSQGAIARAAVPSAADRSAAAPSAAGALTRGPDSGSRRSFAIADLSAAYAKSASKVLRGVAMLDRKAVLVQDEIESDHASEVEWVMHTRADAEIDGPDVTLTWNDRKLRLHAFEPADGTWSVQPLKIDSPQRPIHGVNRLVFRFKNTELQTRVVILMWPATGLEKAMLKIAAVPLVKWR